MSTLNIVFREKKEKYLKTPLISEIIVPDNECSENNFAIFAPNHILWVLIGTTS